MNRVLMLSAVIALMLSGAMAAGGSDEKAAPNETRTQALGTIRLINTAEVSFRRSAQVYGSFAELVSKGTLKETAQMNSYLVSAYGRLDLQNPAEPLREFTLAMVVAPDGSAYKLSLVEKKNCGAAFFTDESGIIYEGKALDCAGK